MGTSPGNAGGFGYGRQIQLLTSGIPPLGATYVSQDDQLAIQVTADTAVNVRVTLRLLLPDGTLSLNQHDLNVVSNRAPIQQFIPLSEGWLLSCQLQLQQQLFKRGAVFGAAMLVRNIVANDRSLSMRLFQGYIDSQTTLYWPGGPSEASFSGRGLIRTITGSSGGLGVELSETVPSGAVWRLQSLRFSLTASATVITRSPFLLIDDGANQLLEIGPVAGTTASSTQIYFYAPGLVQANTGVFQQALPTPLYLPQGWRIRTNTGGLQAGDQFTQLQYSVEQWLSI